jgi:PRC-barrel domain protein
MLDKATGKVAYAVMSFGGFLGLGHDHYPIPWRRLTYNERLGGYEVNITDQELKGAPTGNHGFFRNLQRHYRRCATTRRLLSRSHF